MNLRIALFWCLIILVRGVYSQNFGDGFNFYLPPDDTTEGMFLPTFSKEPIDDNEFITIDNGHFSLSGKRIRFFGVNLVADAAFPTRSKSHFIAGRMRKMGINVVRFHHLDNPWSRESLFEWGQDTRHLNPETLDRMELLISELKQQGIYINMNLNVSRTFNSADGVVDADSLADFGKGVTLFDPQLIDLQKEYASQLLTHENPYTGLALVDDPVMAMVEIANENSLYRMWRAGQLLPFKLGGKLTQRHNRMLDSLWNEFLIAKYSTTENLRDSWDSGYDSSDVINRIPDGGFEMESLEANWEMELHSPANALMTRVNDAYEGEHSARITVLQTGDESWYVQWKKSDLSISEDSIYVIAFAARSDHACDISISIQQNSYPWNYYYGTSVSLTTEWQYFRFAFKAPATCENDTRFAFILGAETGSYWFDNLFFGANAVRGLLSEENLEEKNVRRIIYNECLSYSDQRVRDMSSFYIDLQNRYFDDMTAYLKDNLGVKVPITGTNWNVGAADLVSQSRMDYIDNHAYWDHPRFPNIPWSATDWKINNSSMLRDENGGTIAALFGGVPVQNMPYTVSEYNHPFPNRFQTEGLLMISAYGGFHDIDGIMVFDYNSASSDDWESDYIGGYFDIHRNSAMMGLFPSCAKAFREALIRSADQTILIPYSQDDYLLAPKNDNGDWSGYFPVDQKLALKHAMRISHFNAYDNLNPDNYPAAGPFSMTDTEELNWDYDLFCVKSTQFIGLTGWLHGLSDILVVGDLELWGASNVSTLTWISLEDRPLRQSKTSLITLTSRVQNQGMVWDDIYTIHDNWGHSPTEIQPIGVYLNLRIVADSIHVFPLDETGAPIGTFSTIIPDVTTNFKVIINQEETPTLWFGIEAFGDMIGENAIAGAAIPADYGLARIYPNPFNSRTVIEFNSSENRSNKLVIHDIRGTLIRSFKPEYIGGKQRVIWDGKDNNGCAVSSGIYFIQFQSGSMIDTKKCLFLR